jgi:hypothetical protein
MLEKLKNIQKLEASPFLFTRIEQGIRNKQEQKLSAKTIWATVASLSLLILLNLAALKFEKNNQTESYNSTINNNLYD